MPPKIRGILPGPLPKLLIEDQSGRDDQIAQLDQLEQPVQSRTAFKPISTAPSEFAKANQTTGIEWTNATWNPMVGCSVHTAGCTNCYAMKQAAVIPAKHYEGVIQVKNGNPVWTGRLNQSPPHILNKPRTIKKPSMIFVNSMSDFFHENMKLEWQLDAIKVMEDTPQHVYQILTKRPENIMKFVESYGFAFPDNVWVGATMERHDYRHRIDLLREVPARVRFLSIEPLVGDPGTLDLSGIHWVIVGGESGPGARPMQLEWVLSTRDQSVAQGVPYFFKQWGIPQNNPIFKSGGSKAVNQLDPVGKGGSLIEGQSWKQFPNY